MRGFAESRLAGSSYEGWSQEIDAQLYVDLPGKAVFVGYFIPHSPHTVEICRGLVDQPLLTIADLEKKTSVEGGYIGEASKTKLTDLTFTGRVYVYYETNLTAKEVDVLTDVYVKKSLSLVLRGFDYFVAAQQGKNGNPTVMPSLPQGNQTPQPDNPKKAIPTLAPRSDVTMRFIYTRSPALVLVNQSEKMAKNIKWAVEVWNMDLPERDDPLPIPIQTFEFIRPHNEGGALGIFQNLVTAGLIKPGNRLFGSATVDCADCVQGHSYIVYIVWGNGGWFSAVSDEKLGRLITPPRNFLKPHRDEYFKTLETMAKPDSRVPIE